MKLALNISLILLGAALGLAAGSLWRGKASTVTQSVTATNTVATIAPEAPAKSVRAFNNQTVTIGAHDDSPLATKLARDLSMSSGVTRWLYWLEALEKAGPSDLPRLARMAGQNASLARLVAARWFELDPRHMFDAVLAAEESSHPLPSAIRGVLFEEWPKKDSDAVIAALTETKDSGAARSWRMTIAGRIIEKDAERGLKLFSEWNIENYGPRMTAVAKWAAADPRHAAEFALAHPAGYASRAVMAEIAKAWAKADPKGALEFANGKRGHLTSHLETEVLKEWSSRNLNSAAEWLSTVDISSRNRLSPAFVESWAKQDAPSALAWCEANLTGSTLNKSVGALMRGAAARDVTAAAELVTAMAPSAARAEAAVSVLEKWMPAYSSSKPVATEAVLWLSTLDPASLRKALDQNHWRWAESDPKGFAAFLATLNAEQLSHGSLGSLARNLARTNPAEAMTWANTLPEQHRLLAGTDALYEWQRSQPEAALNWVLSLPANDARRASFLQSSIASLVHQPGGEAQLARLPPEVRPTARETLRTLQIDEVRRTLLLETLKDP
jgi:hypothetical protein